MTTLTTDFNGNPVTTIEYKGKYCWIAAEIGRAMGYSQNGGRLVTRIKESWSEELIPNRDYIIITGSELAEFKLLFKDHPIFGGSFTARLMLLFESGLHFVCLKTSKPVGIKLRRFLVDIVMPQLVRNGAYLPDRTVEDGKLAQRPELPAEREVRLKKQFEYKAHRALIRSLRKSAKISEDAILAYELSVTEEMTGKSISAWQNSKRTAPAKATPKPRRSYKNQPSMLSPYAAELIRQRARRVMAQRNHRGTK